MRSRTIERDDFTSHRTARGPLARFAGVLLPAVLLALVVWGFPLVLEFPPVHGQGTISDFVGPSLTVRDSVEWDVFASALDALLGDPRFEVPVESGDPLRFLGFERVTAELYHGTAVFESQDLVRISWDYDAQNGSLSSWNVPLPLYPLNLDPTVIIADTTSWSFLAEVTESAPAELLAALAARPLVRVWVERSESLPDRCAAYFQFGDDASCRTVKVWADVTGNGFGPLHVDD